MKSGRRFDRALLPSQGTGVVGYPAAPSRFHSGNPLGSKRSTTLVMGDRGVP